MKHLFVKLLFLIVLGLVPQEARAQDGRLFSRDGVSFYLPLGWKMTADTSNPPITMYTAETRDGAFFLFYRLPPDTAGISSREFAEMTNADRQENMKGACPTCLVVSSGIKPSQRRISSHVLSGYQDSYVVRNLADRNERVYQLQEFYQVDTLRGRLILTSAHGSNVKEKADINYIYSTLNVK
jgi:hypothetical protein